MAYVMPHATHALHARLTGKDNHTNKCLCTACMLCVMLRPNGKDHRTKNCFMSCTSQMPEHGSSLVWMRTILDWPLQ